MDPIERAFRSGFRAGFRISRDGFNNECPYDHLAPSPPCSPDTMAEPFDGAVSELESSALNAFAAFGGKIQPVNRRNLPCFKAPHANERQHSDPDNSGQCIYCGAILDLGEGETDPPIENSRPQHPQK